MELGKVGLGRMGGDKERRLQKSGHRRVVFDKSSKLELELEV